MKNCISILISKDGISDGVEGEYPRWGTESITPQHGL